MKNEIASEAAITVNKFPPTQREYQLISQWLNSQFYHSVGATFFLNQTQEIGAQWHLLRLYDPKEIDTLLGVAVVYAGGTCFWLPAENSMAELLFAAILDLRPHRIVTTLVGRDLLRSAVVGQTHLVREYDQWIMICTRRFPQARGRMARLSDIARLIEYQRQYNDERSVTETSDWNVLVTQKKVVVYEVDDQIVSIVRFGIETSRLVSIGGTYTFPNYRRQGFAERVLEFAVDQIVATGRTAHLIVDIDNIPAIELYRKMGFESAGSSYVAYLEYS